MKEDGVICESPVEAEVCVRTVCEPGLLNLTLVVPEPEGARVTAAEVTTEEPAREVSVEELLEVPGIAPEGSCAETPGVTPEGRDPEGRDSVGTPPEVACPETPGMAPEGARVTPEGS